ncbi:MAG: fibronectin type III domain-containing protein [Verrucomicrobia bacterium]|nr:fibronectin type III domain-containing protein [Verrucomicrobiota bacterium]
MNIIQSPRVALKHLALALPMAAAVCLFAAGSARGAITFDAQSSAGSAAAPASVSWFHTVGTGTDRMLVVGITTESSTNVAATSVTFGGTPLAPVTGGRAFSTNTPYATSDIWYLAAPAEGPGEIIVSFATAGAATAGATCGAVSLFGVQSAPEAAATYGGTTSGTTYSLPITPLTDGAWLVEVICNGSGGATLTPTSSQTKRWFLASNPPANSHSAACGTREARLTDPSSAFTETWTSSGSSRRALSVAAFAPVAAPAPAADIVAFDFGVFGPATLSGTTFTVKVPDGTDVTALTPTYTKTVGATCPKASGSAQNFTSPVHYLVTSSDSGIIDKDYTVQVVLLPVVTIVTTPLTISAAATGAEILHGAALVEANHFYDIAASVTLGSGLTFGTSYAHTSPAGWSGGQKTDLDAHNHVTALTDTTPGSAAAAFRTLMRSYTWSSVSTHTLTIPGMIPGHTYRLQLISPHNTLALVSVEGTANVTWTGGNTVFRATWIQSPGDTELNVVLTRNGPELETNGYVLHDMSVLPSTPTALVPTPLVGEIRLDWTKANGAAQYNVKRSTTSGSGYVTIGTTTDPGTIYHDTAVTNGVTYYYVVSATNAAGEGPDSAEVSSTPSVILASQTISFNLPLTLSMTTLDPAFVDIATATSLLTVTYSSDNETVATVDELGTVTIHGVPGVAHILADQAGNFAYLPAPQVSQELTVTAVTPVLTWNNPRAIAVGTLLSSTQLNAIATTTGTFTYTPDSGVELPVGSHLLSVHFTPANEVAYTTPADKTVSITVGTPAGPTVTNVNYGLASNASMNGIYSFDPGASGSASQPAPAAYGGNVWNDFGFPSEAGSSDLLDSFGASTGVGFSWGPGAVSSPYNDWNGLGTNRLLVSGRFLTTTTYAPVFTLTGLNAGHKYDLYIASLHNTEVDSVDFQAVGAATAALHCQYVNATAWVAGQNHVHFTDVAPAADGTLVVNAQRPGGGYLNGFQLVDLGVAGSADYLAWAASFTDFNDTAAGSDPDGDNMSNFEEYAFGLDPTSGTSVNPITVQLDQATGTFKYTRRATPTTTGLTYTYESSATLNGDWLPFTPVLEPSSDNGTPVEVITVQVPAELLVNPALFVRVKAAP